MGTVSCRQLRARRVRGSLWTCGCQGCACPSLLRRSFQRTSRSTLRICRPNAPGRQRTTAPSGRAGEAMFDRCAKGPSPKTRAKTQVRSIRSHVGGMRSRRWVLLEQALPTLQLTSRHAARSRALAVGVCRRPRLLRTESGCNGTAGVVESAHYCTGAERL